MTNSIRKSKISLIICDDHAIVRAGLKQLVCERGDITVDGEAGDGQELLEMIRKRRFDIVLLDISLPGRNGIDILKQLKIEKPDLPVLMISIHDEEQYAFRAYKAGASGYIKKDAAPDLLIDAILRIHSGHKYISPEVAETLVQRLDHGGRPTHDALSDREYQVFAAIAVGKSLKEIAQLSNLSVKTVSTYRSRILEKMNLKNNIDLVKYAIDNKIIEQ
jgi:two-component system, NarL family, invasion response regulator UvrY